MIKEFLQSLYTLAIDMGYYMMIGLALVAILNIFMKKQWIAKHLGGSSIWACIKASIFGVPLPLCSCGVVPTGLYLIDKGASKASTVSFLISTPQTGVDSIIATYGLMGPLFAIYRPIAAFVSGVIGGIAVTVFGKKEKTEEIEDVPQVVEQETQKPIKQRTINSIKYAFGEFVEDISFHFVIGLVVAALISILMPTDFLISIGLGSGIASMLLMIAIGAPMYICSTSSIPIAIMLMAKGLSPGAAFVFLFMGPFTNAASLIMISKKFGKRTTAIYFLSAAVASIGFGLILDYIVNTYNISFAYLTQNLHEMSFSWWQIGIACIFLAIVLYYLIKKSIDFIRKMKARRIEIINPAQTFRVEGMDCGGCASGLESALRQESDVDNAEVNFEEKQLKVWGNIDSDEVKKIIKAQGYSIT
ncbi:MAG: permease [Clostridiales bacterium]|nr:permease [Clostridiales bacterium]